MRTPWWAVNEADVVSTLMESGKRFLSSGGAGWGEPGSEYFIEQSFIAYQPRARDVGARIVGLGGI